MGGQQNVIEINGKKYDAATGKLLDGIQAELKKTTKLVRNQGSIDGFSRPAQSSKPTTVASVTKPKITGPAHQKAAHAAKPVQKSQTLMRSAVKKPAPKPAKPAATHNKSSLGSSPQRHKTAQSIQKSPQIHRYQTQNQGSVITKVQELEVKAHIEHAQPAHHANHTASPAAHRKPHMSAAAKMIENSLASATAHENPIHSKPKKHRKLAHKLGVSSRTMAISSTVLAGVLLGGFFAVQNIPNLSMRVAAARAGFDANMPGYNPSGFSFKGPINYSPGKVTVSFRSNTDDRNYDVTQQASNWNSDALLANYIVEEDKQYQTYLDRGRTLFIYDGSNATWVDDGVWYQIEGNSSMTTDQLVRVAASI